jgi:endonuclease/exonuclease/phosphatase family metal-dependent hydrolase
MRRGVVAGVIAAMVLVVGWVGPARPGSAVAGAAAIELRVGVWNSCAEFAECPAVADATGRVNRAAALVRDRSLDALLLLETCEWHVSRLLTALGAGWDAAFAPWRQNDTEGGWPGRRTRPCGDDRYALGLAVLTRGGFDQSVLHTLPSPTARYSLEAPLLCVRRTTPLVRLCASHFTPAAYDPGGTIRAAQRARVVEVLRGFAPDPVVFGGDLNVLPPNGSWTPPATATGPGSPMLAPLYDLLRECDQADGLALTGRPRAGESTTSWGDPPTWGKLDYLFASPYPADPAATFASCDALDGVPAYRTYSDHLPLVGTVRL